MVHRRSPRPCLLLLLCTSNTRPQVHHNTMRDVKKMLSHDRLLHEHAHELSEGFVGRLGHPIHHESHAEQSWRKYARVGKPKGMNSLVKVLMQQQKAKEEEEQYVRGPDGRWVQKAGAEETGEAGRGSSCP